MRTLWATEAVSNFTSEQTDKAKELASKGSSKAKELTESRVIDIFIELFKC